MVDHFKHRVKVGDFVRFWRKSSDRPPFDYIGKIIIIENFLGNEYAQIEYMFPDKSTDIFLRSKSGITKLKDEEVFLWKLEN
jgi:hypothetical protein